MKHEFLRHFIPQIKAAKFILLQILILALAVPASAQSSVTIGPTSGSGSQQYGPYVTNSSTAYKSRHVYLYTSDELNLPDGAVITGIGWLKSNNSVVTGNNTFNLWVENTSRTTLGSSATPWGNFITGAGVTQLYGSTTRAMTATSNEYEEFPAEQAFAYTGGNLLVLTDWAAEAGGNATNQFYYQSAPGMSLGTRLSASATPSNSTTVGSTTYSNSRPTIRISYTVPPVNAGVSGLVSPGEVYLCETATTQEIRVEIKNYGSDILNNVRVYMEVDGGTPTYVDWTTPIDVYGSTGGNTAVVSLGNISFAQNAHTLKIWTALPNGIADTLNADDTLHTTISAKSLNGVYTIGGTAPDFATVQDAAAHLNANGVCGPVTFLIRDGVYTGQVTLEGTIPLLSAANPVVFRSESGNAADVVIDYNATTTSNNWVVRLNGASHISFRKLTLRATGTTYGRVIDLVGAASENTVDGCVLIGTASTTTSSPDRRAVLCAASVTGGNNVFTNNIIRNGSYGIYYIGLSANRAYGLVFDNNTIEDAYMTSAHFQYTDNLKFRNNTINITSTYTSYKGLYCSYGYNDLEITANRITGMVSGYGMDLQNNNGTAAGKGLVANNVISFGSNTTASYGIYNLNSSYQRFYNNSVHVTGTNASTYAGYFSWSSTSYNNNEVLNNVFANSGGGRSLYFVTPVANSANILDYNNLYTTGSILVRGGISTSTANLNDYADLSAWRSSPLTRDRNSISHVPGFTSATDLRPDAANEASWSLNGRGIHITGNDKDIDGNARVTLRKDGVPDIGAYEFTPSVTPPLAASSVSGSVTTFTFGSDTVATVDWGAATPESLSVRQYTGTIPANALSDYMYFYTDIAAPGGSYNYTAGVYYKDPWLGNITAEGDLRLAQSAGASWNVYAGTVSSIDTSWKRLQVSGLSGFSAYTGSLAKCSGQPPAASITTSPASYALCAGSIVSLSAVADPATDGLSDITYQWEDSTAGGVWAAVSSGTGGGTLDYTSDVLSEPVWFRVRATCTGSSQSAFSAIYEVPVTIRGTVTHTVPGERCGPGTVELKATGTPGSTLLWFDNAGLYAGRGDTLTTPVLTANTTYSVLADAGGRTMETGLQDRTGTGTYTGLNYGLIFDAGESFTLDSVAVYPIGNGIASTITVRLYRASGSVLLQETEVPVTGTAAPGIKTMIPLDFYVPAGTNYRLVLSARGSAVTTMGHQPSGAGYPHEIPGIVTIRGGTSSSSTSSTATNTTYYYFYDWKISTHCAGPQVPVEATVHSLPVVTVTTSDPLTFCAVADHAVLNAVPTVAGFDYHWTHNGDTIAGATGSSYAANDLGAYGVLVTDTNSCTGTSSNTQQVVPALSGIYTIGGTAPDFTTIASAASHLHTYGVCGPVTFLIRSGEYNERTIINGTIPGLSAANHITFRSEEGVADSVRIFASSTSTSNNYVWRLNAASHISLRQLTFEATGTTYSRVIELTGAASDNVVDSCVLISPMTTSTSTSDRRIVVYGSNAGLANNVFSNNRISGGNYGIYFGGTSTSALSGSNIFEGNRIEDAYQYSAYFQYISDLKFRKNEIRTGSATTHYGVYMNYADSSLEVSGNLITGIRVGYGISLNNNRSIETARGLTFNNVVITGSGTGAQYGIYASGTRYQRIYNNSVHITGTGTGTSVYAGYFTLTGVAVDNEVLNNVFANSGGGRSLYFLSAAANNNICDYNNLYASGANLATVGTSATNHTTLSSLRNSPLRTDRNSISHNPGFTSATDLRPDASNEASWSLNGRGIHIMGNDKDIDGNARVTLRTDGVPDIGAYEFTPSVTPPLAASSVSGTVETFTFGSDTVATIDWGTATPLSLSVRQYTGTIPANALPDYMYFYTDIAAPGGSYNYTAGVYYKDPWLGNIATEADLRLAQSAGATWNVYTGMMSTGDTSGNVLAVAGLNTFSGYSGSLSRCSGQPGQADIITAALQYPRCSGDTILLTAVDIAGIGVSGISYQWEDSTSSGSWVPVTAGSGGTTLQYASGVLTETIWYRLRVTCDNSGQSVVSNVYEVPVVPPGQVTNVVHGERCGPGTVELNAVGTPGSVLYWFDAPVGGARLDTGNRFITPSLSTDDVFYVSADAGGRRTMETGLPERIGTTNTSTNNYGLIFDADESFTLDSVAVYPIGNGTASTITVRLYRTTGGVLLQEAEVPVTGTAAPGIKTMIPLDFYVPAGTGYRLALGASGSGVTSLGYESSSANSGYPHEIPGVVTIRGGTGSTSLTSTSISTAAYYYFYDWKISTRCEGPRVPVEVKIHSLPVVTVTTADPLTFCAATDHALLNAVPTVPGFDYQWTRNGDTIAGAMGSSYTATRPGAHGVLVTDTNSCTGTSSNTQQVVPALSGVYTIGGTAPDFTTIASAASHLHTYGVCGPVTFLIRSGEYNERTIISGTIPGLSAANHITFRSEEGVADSVRIFMSNTSSSTNYVWRLNAASHISLRQLTLEAMGTTYGRVVELAGAATDNLIDSCVLLAPMTTSTSIPVNRSVLYGSNAGLANNVFSNNRISGGNYGIYFGGTSTSALAEGNIFEGNRIEDAYQNSVYFQYTDNLKFRNNTLHTNSTYTGHQGLYCQYGDNELEITGNRITGMVSGYGMYLAYNDGSATGRGLIANNVISFGSNATMSYGIYSTNSSYQRFYNNSVHVTGTNASAYAGYFSWSGTSYNNNEVLNNVFANTGGGRGLYLYTAAANNNSSDYNNIYTTGTVLATGGTSSSTTYAALSNWRGSPLGTDRNSISHNPGFTSATDLRPDASNEASWSLNGRGIHIAGNDKDIDGNARVTLRTDGVPDIGAYEFTPAVAPPLAVATPAVPAVSSTQVFTFGEDTVARVTWGTFSALPANISVRQYTGTLPANALPDYMYFYTDMDVTPGVYDYTTDVYYKDPWLGNITLEQDLRLAQERAGTWDVYTGVASNGDTQLNILTVAELTGFSQYTGSLAHCSGQPTAPTLVTNALLHPRCLGDTIIITAVNPANFGVSGISYQWEDSTSSGSWAPVTTGSGGTTLQYVTDALTDTVWLRLQASCVNSLQTSVSAVYEVPVVPPGQITDVTPGSHCGPGQVMLSAAGTAGSVLYWFDAPVGGSRLGTGNQFETPSLSADSVFYVSADGGGKRTMETGLPERVGVTNTSTNNYGLIFDADESFTLDSVAVYPIGNGTASTITVSLYRTSGGVLLQQAEVPVTGSATPGVKTMIPLNFYVPVGTGYRLVLSGRGSTSAISGLAYESSAANSAYPHEIPGVLTIRGGTGSTSLTSTSVSSASYYYFYDWRVSTQCEGPRVAVQATIHDLPVVAVTSATPPSPFCAQTHTMRLDATPVVPGFDYQWLRNNNPIPGATDTFHDAAQAGDYVVSVTDTNSCTGTAVAAVSVTPMLNGNYTIGGTDPDFTTLPLAISYLHTHGVCGPVTFLLRSGEYEERTIINGTIPGLSAANHITFRSEEGVADSVRIFANTTSTSNNYVWQLNGASHISLSHLTLQSTGTTYGRVVDLAGAASDNVVDSCVLIGSTSTTTSSPDRRAVICASSVTGGENVFTNNMIRNGSYGIYYTGSSTNQVDGIVFENNTIEDVHMTSAYFGYTDNLKFRNNTINISSTYTSHTGLHCEYGDNDLEITGNRITGMVSGNGMSLQYNDGTAAGKGLVANNTVSVGSGTGTIRGIYSYRSSYQRFYNNSVHVTGTSSTGYAGYFDYNGTAYVENEIYNNVFANTGGGRGLYMYTAVANNNSSDYNNIYTTGTILATGGTSTSTTYAALSNWRGSPLGFDGNSISYRPGFTSATDLRPDPADSAVWSLNGRGIQIAGNDSDIEGNPRSTVLRDGVPDIGAYEFEPVSEPPLAVAAPVAPAAGVTQTFTFGGDTVARIAWASGAAVPAEIGVKAYSGRMAPNLTLGDTMYFHTGIDVPAGSYDYTANIYYKDPWLGTVTAEADLYMAKQNSNAMWILYGGTRSTVDVNRNILTAPGLRDFFLFTGSRQMPCTGQPMQPVIDNLPLASALCERDSITLNATDFNPYSGIVYQWQQASQISGPWVNVTGGTGGTDLSYNTGALYDTVYYRLNLTCTQSGLSAQSTTEYEVPVMSPGVITDTFPSERCGPGTLTLEAYGTPGHIIRWYNMPSGGTLLHTGNLFTTPLISITTVYYVAVSNGICESLRIPVTATVNALPVATVNAPRRHICYGDSVVLSAQSGYGYQWQQDGADIPGATNSSYAVYEEAGYRVIVSGGGSCVDTSQIIPIVVYPALVPTVLSDGQSLLTSAGFVRYQWNRDGVPVPGATSISYTPDSAGAYTVSVTDTNGCTGVSAAHQINVGIITPAVVSVPVRIYPNPATGMVFMDVPVYRYEVRITSLDGKEVFRGSDAQSVDIGWLPDGMYLIRIMDHEGMLLKAEKLMKTTR